MTRTRLDELALDGALIFPPVQVPSADPNALDDAERGQFTPVLSFGGSSVGIVYTVQAGRFLKVANRVFFSLRITLSSKGVQVGNVSISGMPFTCVNTVNGGLAALALWASTLTFAGLIQAATVINTAALELSTIASGGAAAVMTNANFSDTTTVVISGNYEAVA